MELTINNSIPKDWGRRGKFGKPLGVGWAGESLVSLWMEEPGQKNVERDDFNQI